VLTTGCGGVLWDFVYASVMSFRASVKKSICSGLGVWLGNLPGMLKALGRICSWTKQKQNITKKKKKRGRRRRRGGGGEEKSMYKCYMGILRRLEKAEAGGF
jgi:hypothetical protein